MNTNNVNLRVEDIWQLQRSSSVAKAPSNIRTNIQAAAAPVVFDPDNKDHRMAFATFLETQRLPDGFRFASEFPCTSAVTTIERKLVQWALRKELTAAKTQAETLAKARKPAVTLAEPEVS